MVFLAKFHIVFSLVVMCCDSKMEPFVVGGVYTTIGDFPHCIYLAIDCSKPWICGASVLNQNILITAAHCVNGCDTMNPDHLIEAFAGHENLQKVKSKREAGVIKVHEEYHEHTAANDIALVGLKRSMYLGHNVKRIFISPQFPNVRRGEVAGWGIVDEERAATGTILKSVPQKIRSARVCSLVGKLEAGMFCAGSTKEGGHHPANGGIIRATKDETGSLRSGDSGSALVTNDYTELGLVSFRSRRLPALMVYTNVTYYYKWIKYNARRLYCQIFERHLPRPEIAYNKVR